MVCQVHPESRERGETLALRDQPEQLEPAESKGRKVTLEKTEFQVLRAAPGSEDRPDPLELQARLEHLASLEL